MTTYSYDRTAQDTPTLDDPEGDAADIEAGLAVAQSMMSDIKGALRTFEAGVNSDKPRKTFIGMAFLVGNLSLVAGEFGEAEASGKLLIAAQKLRAATRKYRQ